MESNFKVKCPNCAKENDFGRTHLREDLIEGAEEGDFLYIECMHCNFPLEIVANAIYTIKLVNSEYKMDFIDQKIAYYSIIVEYSKSKIVEINNLFTGHEERHLSPEDLIQVNTRRRDLKYDIVIFSEFVKNLKEIKNKLL